MTDVSGPVARGTAKPLIAAAQYLRMSSDQQVFSLESQAGVIAAFAEKQGYEIVETYSDAGRSGVTAAGRGGLLRLLRDVASSPPYRAILVLDVSRWGRYQDPDEAAHYEFICREAGVRVVYCAEAFEDDETLSSGLVKNLKRMMAAEYSRQLSDRCRAGIRRAMKEGGRSGGAAPFGFSRAAWDPERGTLKLLEPGERKPRPGDRVRNVPGPADQIAVLKRIFHLYVREVWSVRSIRHLLNDEGTPYSQPGPWTNDRVRKVLANELAIGVSVINKTTQRLGKKQALEPGQWERVPVGPALVSKRLFAGAQTRLARDQFGRRDDEELIAELKRILKTHGYLSRALVKAHAPSTPPLYQARFGTLLQAYRLAGYDRVGPDGKGFERNALSREEVLAALRDLVDREGYLSVPLIDRTPWIPCAATLRCRYGPLPALYREAGYDRTFTQICTEAQARRRGKRLRLVSGGSLGSECAADSGKPGSRSDFV